MSRSLRILHLEDNPYDAELIRETLVEAGIHHKMINADDRNGFVSVIEQGQLDLIIADFALPSFDGQTALTIAQEKCPHVPFIFVSGAIGEERAIESLKQGATDYVLKHRLSGLIPAIRRALREVEERGQRQQAVASLAVRVQQQAAVAELGQLALVNTHLPQLMDETVTLVAQALNVEYGELLQLLPDNRVLRLVAGVGWQEGLVGQATVEADLTSQAGYTLFSQEPVVVPDLLSETRFTASPLVKDHGLVSGMSVVVSGAEHPFGVLGTFTRHQRSFTEDDIYFLQSMAHVLATAIERKQREEQLRQSRNQLRAILEGISEGITVQRPDGSLIYANEMAAQLSGYPTVQAFVNAPLGEIAQKFELRDEAGQPFPVNQLPGRLALQGQASDDVILRFRPVAGGEERWSVVSATPIFDEQGEVQFAVNIFRDVTERTRLYQREKEARQQAEAITMRIASLQVVTASLSEALTPLRVAQLVVEQGLSVLGAQAGSVVVLNEEEAMLEILYSGGYQQNIVNRWQRFSLTASTPISEVVRTGQAIFLSSPQAAIEQYPLMEPYIKQTGSRAWATLPLEVEGRTIGAFGLSFTHPQVFDKSDQTFMLALGRQCAQALERARLYEAEYVARAEAEIARHRLGFLAEASAILASSLDYQLTLNQMAYRAVPQIADWCTVILTKERNTTSTMDFVAVAHRDPEKTVWATELLRAYSLTSDMPFGLRNVLRTGQTELYPDFPQTLLTTEDNAENRDTLQLSGVRSVMIVPLKARERILGGLVLAIAESERVFDQDDLALAEDLARRIALAVDNARLYWEATQINEELENRVMERTEQLRRLTQKVVTTQEEERQRLSRELHDEAGQALTALKISLGLIENDLPEELEVLKQRMAEAVALTKDAMDQIRHLAHDLRPPSLDMVGLNLTLEGFCREFAQRTHLNIGYTGTNLPEISETVSTTFYRLLQEALTNVARHAQAHEVQVVLSYDDEKLSLRVADDGRGFNGQGDAAAQMKGIGLLGMQERLELLSGWLEIESKPGQGTTLTAYVKL